MDSLRGRYLLTLADSTGRALIESKSVMVSCTALMNRKRSVACGVLARRGRKVERVDLGPTKPLSQMLETCRGLAFRVAYVVCDTYLDPIKKEIFNSTSFDHAR